MTARRDPAARGQQKVQREKRRKRERLIIVSHGTYRGNAEFYLRWYKRNAGAIDCII